MFRRRRIEAHQWFQNGDHPEDHCDKGSEGKVVRRYRRPDIPGEDRCGQCKSLYHAHGWIDTGDGGWVVCPGDWIVTDGGGYFPNRSDTFLKIYERVDE